MPRALASQRADAEARRQARLEEQRARNEHRLSRQQSSSRQDPPPLSVFDLPPLLSLSTDGRMGRLRFFSVHTVGMAVLGLLMFSFLGIGLLRNSPGAPSVVPVALLGLVAFVWGLRLVVLRLHDLGFSGWWALLMFVAGLNGIFVLALLFWPGNRDENDYGPPVDDARLLPLLLSLVILAVAFAWVSPRH
ncbi:MAG: hypothetical protein C4K60_01480 [Ideonella sp. MAG2]|nr:MAG: hypothetical protein C4K60_01480 [Ideonella sp. MAG2]